MTKKEIARFAKTNNLIDITKMAKRLGKERIISSGIKTIRITTDRGGTAWLTSEKERDRLLESIEGR